MKYSKNLLFIFFIALSSCSSNRSYRRPHYYSSAKSGSRISTPVSVASESSNSFFLNRGAYSKKKSSSILYASNKAPVPPVTEDYQPTKPAQTVKSKSTKPAESEQNTGSKVNRRILIYTAFFKIEVVNMDKPVENAINKAIRMGGYLKAQNNTSITLRIPVASFKKYVNFVEKLGKITQRNISSQDVTAQYFDMSIRLKSLLATQNRLLAILKKAKKVKDILTVEKELQRVNAKIELIKGRLRYMINLADFSTINISFFERYVPKSTYGKKLVLQTPAEWIKNFNINALLGK